MSFASSTRHMGERINRSVGRRAHQVRTPAFYALTVLFLGFLVFALRESMMMAVNGWLAGYPLPTHRVHHIMIGGMLTVFTASIAIQLYRPVKRVGAFQAALAFVFSAFVLSIVASGLASAAELIVFIVPVAILAVLHPARRQLLPTTAHIHTGLLALAGIGTIFFAIIGAREFIAHTTLANDHVLFGHYEFMTIVMVSIALFAILAALRPVGWRALMYAAVALAILFAGSSLVFPGVEQGSSLGTLAALAVIVWAITFAVFGEYVDRAEPVEDSRPSVMAG